MKWTSSWRVPVFPALLMMGLMSGCGKPKPQPGEVQDEAMRANRSPASLPAADEDYFHDMDSGFH